MARGGAIAWGGGGAARATSDVLRTVFAQLAVTAPLIAIPVVVVAVLVVAFAATSTAALSPADKKALPYAASAAGGHAACLTFVTAGTKEGQ